MKKSILLLAVCCCVIMAQAETLKLKGYGFHPRGENGVKMEKTVDLNKGIYRMTFQPGTAKKGFSWFVTNVPLQPVGTKLGYNVYARVRDLKDPGATITLGIQGGHRKYYLNSKDIYKKFKASECVDQEKDLEFIFTVPDPKEARDWDKAECMSIRITVNCQDAGVFEFRTPILEKVR